MNLTETIALLDVISAYDKRKVGEADLEVWQEQLADLPYDECRAAVTVHHRNSPDVWLKPGHVRAIVRAAQNDRAMRPARTHNGCPRGSSCCTGPLIKKPSWFDELAADSRLAARERWYLPDGRHRAYVGAEQPPHADRSKREDAA